MGMQDRFRTHVAIALVTLLSAAAFGLLSTGRRARVEAQGTQSGMEARLNQVIAALQNGKPPAVQDAINDGMEILYGGTRPLPTKGPAMGQTEQADTKVGEAELRLAQALENATKKEQTPQGALDLKLFIEQMNEVAKAVGEITSQCGQGDNTNAPPCDELQPRLNEQNGEEVSPGPSNAGVISPGYTVKLRGPAVPPWFSGLAEDVRVTEPIASGECAVVFKETQGLMVRLRFDRITVVQDPWVSTFGIPRGTAVPIWTLQWVPAEFVKEWNLCNVGGSIDKTVTQRVVQTPALNFFWKFYPKDP
ncbi:MAG: hypothetical protein ACRDH9_01125 [Actinomycetota bacterium]